MLLSIGARRILGRDSRECEKGVNRGKEESREIWEYDLDFAMMEVLSILHRQGSLSSSPWVVCLRTCVGPMIQELFLCCSRLMLHSAI